MSKISLWCLAVLLIVSFSCSFPDEDDTKATETVENQKIIIAPPSGIKQTVKTLTTLTFIWNPVKGASSYSIYFKDTTSDTYTKLPEKVLYNRFTHSGLQIGRRYNYKISAVFPGDVESGLSRREDFETALHGPEGFLLEEKTDKYIILKWKDRTDWADFGIIEYDLYRRLTNSSDDFVKYETIKVKEPYFYDTTDDMYRFKDDKISNGQSYSYALVVKNSVTDSNLSGTLDIQVAKGATEITSTKVGSVPHDIAPNVYYDFLEIMVSQVDVALGYNIYKYDSKDALLLDIADNIPDSGDLLKRNPSHTYSLTGAENKIFYTQSNLRSAATSGGRYYVTAAAVFSGDEVGSLFSKAVEIITIPQSPRFKPVAPPTLDSINSRFNYTLEWELAPPSDRIDGFQLYGLFGDQTDDRVLLEKETRDSVVLDVKQEYPKNTYTYNFNARPNEYYMFHISSFLNYSVTPGDTSSNVLNLSGKQIEESNAYMDDIGNEHQVIKFWVPPVPVYDADATVDYFDPDVASSQHRLKFSWKLPDFADQTTDKHDLKYEIVFTEIDLEGTPTIVDLKNKDNVTISEITDYSIDNIVVYQRDDLGKDFVYTGFKKDFTYTLDITVVHTINPTTVMKSEVVTMSCKLEDPAAATVP